MDDDKKQRGLKGIPPPAHIQHQRRTETSDSPAPFILSDPLAGRAPPLKYTNDALELLEQVRDGARQFLAAGVGSEAERNWASICAAAAEGMLSGSKKNPNWSSSDASSLGLFAYLYSTLASPSAGAADTARLVDLVERQLAGPRRVEREREIGRQWIRQRAIGIWERDSARALRIGQVAEQLRSLVANEVEQRAAQGDTGPRQYWPQSLDAIRRIIREVAPEYASRSGKPRKA